MMLQVNIESLVQDTHIFLWIGVIEGFIKSCTLNSSINLGLGSLISSKNLFFLFNQNAWENEINCSIFGHISRFTSKIVPLWERIFWHSRIIQQLFHFSNLVWRGFQLLSVIFFLQTWKISLCSASLQCCFKLDS